LIDPNTGTFPISIHLNSETIRVSANEVSLPTSRIEDRTRPVKRIKTSKKNIFGIFFPSHNVTMKPRSGKKSMITEIFIKNDSDISLIS
jgi:hypothetical protein